MCNRILSVRESSRISLFSGGDPFCWSGAAAGEHTRGADRSAWVTSGFLPSIERTADRSPSPYRPLNLWFQSKITDLTLSFQVPCGSMYILFASRIFLFMVGYRNLHTSVFSANLLFLSVNGNIYHSIKRQKIIFSPSYFIFLFPVKTFCWCYLATALNLLSSSSPAKLVYYTQLKSKLIHFFFENFLYMSCMLISGFIFYWFII